MLKSSDRVLINGFLVMQLELRRVGADLEHSPVQIAAGAGIRPACCIRVQTTWRGGDLFIYHVA